jgi:hypothetical protein
MKNKLTICKNCEFFHNIFTTVSGKRFLIDPQCISEQAPLQDFISGRKLCKDINTDGKCKFYKKRPESTTMPLSGMMSSYHTSFWKKIKRGFK